MSRLLKAEIKERFKQTYAGKFVISLRSIFRSIKYRIKYYRCLICGSGLSDIEVISIEFCSICNLKCRYCHLEARGRPHFLDLEIYKKLLNEICQNKGYKIKIMEWPISGCFFLHPRYKEIITLTREYKEKYKNFSPWIILNDNMMLFDADRADFILEQGIINQIICSIDGMDKDTFERMRPGADFERVINNTFYLLRKNRESKKRIVVQVNNGYDAFCNSKKIDPRLEEIFNHVDHITRWEPADWNEAFHTEKPCYAPAKHFCSFVFESVTLSAPGGITKCCMDLQELTKYGDFTKDTLESIWLSDRRREFLELMYMGKRNLITGCSKCSISYVGQNKFQNIA